MNTSQLGNIGEARILAEFTKRCVPCYLPYGDGNEIDLIAIFNDKINTIQIKTTEKQHLCKQLWSDKTRRGKMNYKFISTILIRPKKRYIFTVQNENYK